MAKQVDPADMVNARRGGELVALANAAPEIDAPSANSLLMDAYEFFAGDEADDDIDEPMLVESMLPIAAPVFLAGLPESRKTTLALLLALCVASGTRFLGRFATLQGSVVLILEEDSARRMRARLRRLARGLELNPRDLPLKIAVQKGVALDDVACVDRLIQECKGSALAVIDSLSRVHGADENDRTAMRQVTRALTRISVETGATVAVIHHMRKRSPLGGDGERPGQRMRGSGDLHALSRATVAFEKLPSGQIKIGCEGNYTADLPPLVVTVFEGERAGHKVITVGEASFRSDGGDDSDDKWASARAAAKCDAVDTAILEVLTGGPKSTRQVRAIIKGRHGSDAVDCALARLEMANRIERGGPCASRSTTPPWRIKGAPQMDLGSGVRLTI